MNRRSNETPLTRAIKTFVRAYAHEDAGLKKIETKTEEGVGDTMDSLRVILIAVLATMSMKDPRMRAEIQSVLGVKPRNVGGERPLKAKKLGQNLVENAGRSKSITPLNSVPRTLETERFVRLLRQLFVGRTLDEDQFFAP